jgi:excisionase family DNA binding protein
MAMTLNSLEGRPDDSLLTPGEVATLFRVDPKTVTRWAASGRITSLQTPGKHRRFRVGEIRALMASVTPGARD